MNKLLLGSKTNREPFVLGGVSWTVLSSNEIVDSVDCWGRCSDCYERKSVTAAQLDWREIRGCPEWDKQPLISWTAANMRSQ